MAQEPLSQTSTLIPLGEPEAEKPIPPSSLHGPSLGIPQNSGTSEAPNRDLWREAIDRFRQNVDPKQFAKIVEVKSLEELLKVSSDYRDKYQSKKLPRMISWSMPFLQHLRSFCSVIDTMVQANPTIAALVWGSLKLILEITVRSADVLSNILNMFEQLCDDLPRYKRYALLFPKSVHLENALLRMYMEIISFCSQLVNYFTRNPIRNILRATLHSFESEFGRTLERVRRHNAHVDSEALTASMEMDKLRFEELQKHFDQSSIFSRVRLPCHMIPFGENKRFFGRSTELQRMASSAIGSLDKKQKVIVVQGLGGVGKSEVALKFMHDHLADFAAIFWISAEGEGKIAQSYCDIARRLELDIGDFQSDQKRAFEAVTQWLSSTDIKWMMVFDNACDDGFTDLEASWPQGKNGTIVITTRNTATSHHFAAAEAIHLEPFEPVESAIFLESMIANSSYTMPDYHDEEVRRISNLLGGLPLAISQMVGFLSESGCPLDEFVDLYSSYENIETLHATSTAGSTTFYQHTLSTVWAMSISGLDPNARVLLDLIAFLDPDSIPITIFQTLQREKLPKSLEFLSNRLKLRLSFKKLLSQCLIKTNAGETTLSIHRLVQFSSLQLMGKERRKTAFDHSLHLLSALFPLHPPYRLQMASIWSQSETLVQHILLLHSRYKDFSEEFGLPIDLAKLLDSCSWYLFERGLYDTALTIFETAEDICKCHEQDQSITLANLYSTFGTIYRNCNNPSKGQELFELAITRRETAVTKGLMEKTNIRLADAYMHLGSALLSLNDIPKSLEYHVRAINIREQHKQCEPQILALSYINIGWAYWQDKQLEKASEVLEKSLQIMDDLQESGSGQSGQPSWALKALGNVRIDQGRWEEAFVLHQKAFDIQLRIWGISHHETGDLCHKLGIHSEHEGHFQNAISWFEKALEVYHSTDLEVKAAVCRTMYRLSKLLAAVGQLEEGHKMHHEAGRIRQEINAIPIDESDNLESYECLVPYWGR